jgi:hypothetical protein
MFTWCVLTNSAPGPFQVSKSARAAAVCAGPVLRSAKKELKAGSGRTRPHGDDDGFYAGEACVVFGGAFGAGTTPVTTTDTAAAEILIGGLGADTLTGGGGADVFRGGAGDDRLVVGDAGFRSVDGGSGTDTLALGGAGITLDLTATPMPAIASIEAFDLTGTGNNTLVLGALEALGLAGAGDDGFGFSTRRATPATCSTSSTSPTPTAPAWRWRGVGRGPRPLSASMARPAAATMSGRSRSAPRPSPPSPWTATSP